VSGGNNLFYREEAFQIKGWSKIRTRLQVTGKGYKPDPRAVLNVLKKNRVSPDERDMGEQKTAGGGARD